MYSVLVLDALRLRKRTSHTMSAFLFYAFILTIIFCCVCCGQLL